MSQNIIAVTDTSFDQEVLKAAKSHGYKDIRFVGAKYN